MSKLLDKVNKIDWKKGIISRQEAELFVKRLSTVLLRFGIKKKERSNEKSSH